MDTQSQSISNQQPLKKCGSYFLHFACLVSSQLQSLSIRILSRLQRLASLGSHAGKVFYKEALTNNRTLTGLVLMFVCAPLFYEAHLFFDYTKVIKGWHYRNWFYWFFTQREEFLFGFFLIGLFVIMKDGYRYSLLPLIATCFCEIIFQSFQINHWSDFYMPFWDEGGLTERAWEVVVVSCVSAFSLVKLIQYLVWLFNHRSLAYVARMDNLCKLLDSSDPVQSGVVKTWNEMKSKNY